MAKAKTHETQAPAVSRTSEGLRDALFDEIDAIRNGNSNPTRANAVAKLATGIADTVRMEIEVSKHAHSAASTTSVLRTAKAPEPLKLGA